MSKPAVAAPSAPSTLTPERLVSALEEALEIGLASDTHRRWYARSLVLAGERPEPLLRQQEHSAKRRILGDLIRAREEAVKTLERKIREAWRAGESTEFVRLSEELSPLAAALVTVQSGAQPRRGPLGGPVELRRGTTTRSGSRRSHRGRASWTAGPGRPRRPGRVPGRDGGR